VAATHAGHASIQGARLLVIARERLGAAHTDTGQALVSDEAGLRIHTGRAIHKLNVRTAELRITGIYRARLSIITEGL
jgi:hypothetical protein